MKTLASLTILLSLMALSAVSVAETPADFIQQYQNEAKALGQNADFDPVRGKLLYNTQGKVWSCASCHTANPTQSGQHAKTSKVIEPLAPSANAARFTKASKVEKWFKRNCNDVLGRECTASEKGDFLTYLLTYTN